MQPRELAEFLSEDGRKLLQRPDPEVLCVACNKPAQQWQNDKQRWFCGSHCKKLTVDAWEGTLFREERQFVRLTLHDAAGLLWCFAHALMPKLTNKLTGVACSTVQQWFAIFRDRVANKEQQYQQDIVFSSQASPNGFCHLQGDATRVKKRYSADVNGVFWFFILF